MYDITYKHLFSCKYILYCIKEGKLICKVKKERKTANVETCQQNVKRNVKNLQ